MSPAIYSCSISLLTRSQRRGRSTRRDFLIALLYSCILSLGYFHHRASIRSHVFFEIHEQSMFESICIESWKEAASFESRFLFGPPPRDCPLHVQYIEKTILPPWLITDIQCLDYRPRCTPFWSRTGKSIIHASISLDKRQYNAF